MTGRCTCLGNLPAQKAEEWRDALLQPKSLKGVSFAAEGVDACRGRTLTTAPQWFTWVRLVRGFCNEGVGLDESPITLMSRREAVQNAVCEAEEVTLSVLVARPEEFMRLFNATRQVLFYKTQEATRTLSQKKNFPTKLPVEPGQYTCTHSMFVSNGVVAGATEADARL